MEEPITDKLFSLEEIDYTRFWGENDKILDFVRILFPKVKLIARGDMLKAVGSAEDIDHFDGKLQAMKTYYDKVGRLNENVIMQIFENGGSTPEAETNEEILSTAIRDFRERFSDTYKHDIVKEILVNVVPDFEIEGLEYIVPQRGDKRKLVAISLKNAEQYRIEKLKRIDKLNPEQRATRTLTNMMKDLHLNELPRHIECFDNSSISGTNAVASCVVFKNAKPSKKDYRHFNIKNADGSDDYAQMREVITRRYSRLLSEDGELPQLLIVDGGKGQLNVAVEVLDNLGLRGTIAAIVIAKRLDEIFFPGDSVPLYIDKNSETIRVIQRLRDEAHRFGITHHRNKRSKSQLHSQLDDIKGVGPQTRNTLLKHFKSLKRIREATLDDLEAVVGKNKASIIFNALKNETN